MANKGPDNKGEQKYVSFYCCFDCLLYLIDVFSASLLLRTLPLYVSCSLLCMTHVSLRCRRSETQGLVHL